MQLPTINMVINQTEELWGGDWKCVLTYLIYGIFTEWVLRHLESYGIINSQLVADHVQYNRI